MKRTVVIIVTAVLCIAAIIMYSKYRISLFEPQYIGYLTVNNSTVVKQLETSLQKVSIASIRADKEFAEVVKEQVKSVKELSFAAIADNEYSVLIAAKKDKLIDQKLFDSIITDISQKKIQPSSTFPQITRYYFNKKFYFFIYALPQYTIITAYTYILPRKFIIKVGLENLLIVIVFIIIGTAVTIQLHKSSFPQTARPDTWQSKSTVNPIEVLCQQYSIASVTIAKKNKKGNLKTIYSFPDKIKNFNIQPEVVEELTQGTHILLEKNSILLFYNNNMSLFFKLRKTQPFKGKTIKDIEAFICTHSENITEYLKKYL